MRCVTPADCQPASGQLTICRTWTCGGGDGGFGRGGGPGGGPGGLGILANGMLVSLTSGGVLRCWRARGPHGSSPQPLLRPRIASKCQRSDAGLEGQVL